MLTHTRSLAVVLLSMLMTASLAEAQARDAYNQFRRLIDQGDRDYLDNDEARALDFYKQAERLVEQTPLDEAAQKRLDAQPRQAEEEYTYGRLYHQPGGERQRYWVRNSFLPAKIKLCEFQPPKVAPVVFRMAALIVRHTDVDFTENGQTLHEAGTLSDDELKGFKDQWTFAMDAVQMYSDGKFKVETVWLDLPKVTLRGLTQDTFKQIFHARHLDPSRLDPPQGELFGHLVANYDGVVFVWHLGKAANAYGGGPMRLPSKNGLLPARACIRAMPEIATNALHEFMHNIHFDAGPVHGPRDVKFFDEHPMKNEIDWYEYLLRSVKDWRKAKYLH